MDLMIILALISKSLSSWKICKIILGFWMKTLSWQVAIGKGTEVKLTQWKWNLTNSEIAIKMKWARVLWIWSSLCIVMLFHTIIHLNFSKSTEITNQIQNSKQRQHSKVISQAWLFVIHSTPILKRRFLNLSPAGFVKIMMIDLIPVKVQMVFQ